MGELERNYLNGSIMLSRSEDGSSPEEYFIKSVIGEGGSTVCYEATRKLKDGVVESGKLKEFYPIDSLKRLENGQLVSGAGSIRKFDEMCNEYIDTYKLLQKVMVDNPKNEILKSYIQYGEILYGSMDDTNTSSTSKGKKTLKAKKEEKQGTEVSDNRRTTVYIWSPGVLGKGFDEYLSEIKKNPYKRPEENLKNILDVMEALTDCIKALHTAGLMHLDIKPSNFLVQYDSDFRIKAKHISLFDINTLCSLDSKFLKISGSSGYCAPEVIKGKADNRSDIYSLGAMLFNAVVISKDISDGLYRSFHYSSISRLVKESALFQASETNSNAVLMARICKIIQKCLAENPRQRYQGCSELKKDIVKAIERLDKMLNTPIEKSREGLSEPTLVIQKLLYEHPLYEAIPKDTKDINILVLGSGEYGQKFIDICLQSGQMSDIKLNITAISDEPEEGKKSYLEFRPAISEFVNINGSLNENQGYATLNFRGVGEILEDDSISCFSRSMAVNREIINNLMETAVLNHKEYHYVFVALGEDRITHSIACLCSENLRERWSYSCPVCYVSEKPKKRQKAELKNKLYAVCVNEPVDMEENVQRMGEMAFNTHICWNDTMNIDVTKEREVFFKGDSQKNKYNRMASFAFALSIKYKLYSLQIECEDLLEAAILFSQQILEARHSNEQVKKKFNRLVDLEHRRWLIEKAAEGWTAPRDKNGNLKLEECVVRGSVKDHVNKTHPCMVRGSETSYLNTPEYTINNYGKWNEGKIDSKLDDLDRMSIELHRCFKHHAEQFKRDSLLQNPDLLAIQNLIPRNCDEIERAFKQYQFVLKNIMNGVESYSRQYHYYQDKLKQSLGVLSEETKSKIEERLKILEHAFFPVIESNIYHNYKAIDEVLIEKIPFILTYQYKQAIAMAFEDGKYQNGRNEAVFTNVAAATVLSPEKIHFLYCYNKDSRVELLSQKLDSVLNYFSKRNVHTGIKLIIACMAEVSEKEREQLQKELVKLSKKYQVMNGNAWFEEERIYDIENYAEAAETFMEYLKENPVNLYDGGNQLFPSVYDNAEFIRQLMDMKISYFEFDWRNKIFSKRIHCEYLRFVKDASFIRIADMFALVNAADNRFHLPEFADDYEILWKIYTGEYGNIKKFEEAVGNWNNLCTCLKKYEDAQKPLAKMILQKEENVLYKTLTYFLPEYVFSTVKMIIDKLVEYGIAEKSSNIVTHTSDTCKLELKISQRYESSLQKVFENPHILLPYYGVRVSKYNEYNSDIVEIKCNILEVNSVDLETEHKEYGKYTYDILEQLEKANFISHLQGDPNHPTEVKFVYSSPRIKKLLISAGEILEVYAYYDVLKTGYFDDVATGYEFSWETGGVKNELNLVLTKGFKSIMVECKAVHMLELDYYHKLHSIAEQFGIGTTKVLIGNTYVPTIEAIGVNTMHRSEGNQLNIKTISSEDKIKNIGQTLVQLMEMS